MEKTSAKRKVAKIAIAILIILMAAILLCYVAPLCAVLAGSKTNVTGDPQIMVIFGYKLDEDGMPPMLKSRLDAALGYLKDHPDVTVVVSGGKGVGEFESEAVCMRDYLVEHGANSQNILMEDNSSTTVENVANTLALLRQNECDLSGGMIAVSNGFHLTRIKMLLKRADKSLSVSTIAAPVPSASDKMLMHLREPFTLLIDFLTAKF